MNAQNGGTVTRWLPGVVSPHDRRADARGVRADACFDIRDPFAVTFRMKKIDWVFAWDLLAAGLATAPKHASDAVVDPIGAQAGLVGDGDVQLRREVMLADGKDGKLFLVDELRLSLSPPSGHTSVWLPTAEVTAFLAETMALLPADSDPECWPDLERDLHTLRSPWS